MNANVLKFPAPDRDPSSEKKELIFNYRQRPVLSTFTNDEAKSLLVTAQRVYSGMVELIEFVDAHRETAISAGIETIAMELCAEHVALEEILETLEESVKRNSEAEITLEGLALLRRLEKLIAEASSNILRFTSVEPSHHPSLKGPSGSSDVMGPFAIFYAIAASLVVVAIIY